MDRYTMEQNVIALMNGGGSGGAVRSVNGQTGDVVLNIPNIKNETIDVNPYEYSNGTINLHEYIGVDWTYKKRIPIACVPIRHDLPDGYYNSWFTGRFGTYGSTSEEKISIQLFNDDNSSIRSSFDIRCKIYYIDISEE